MIVALWALQGFLGASMLAVGLLKVARGRDRLRPIMPWVEDFSDVQIRAIGMLEVTGAIGIVLPEAIHVAPVLSPIAAAGLMAVMIGAAATHIRRREPAHLPVVAVLFALLLFVAVERLGPYGP